ncbi:MAG: hypothetical protein SGCHY_004465 [Lobulomycetales sp.]
MYILLLSFLLGISQAAGPCSGGASTPRTRPEFRQMITGDQLNAQGLAFIEGVNCLARNGKWDLLTLSHAAAVNPHHWSSSFLVWHRLFLAGAEQLMRDCTGNPNIVIPYWDSGRDSGSPENSPIWNFFGGNGTLPEVSGVDALDVDGQEEYGNCVTTGPFTDIRLKYARRVLLTTGIESDCLRRNLNPDIQILSNLQIETLINGDFAAFSQGIEGQMHSRVHLFVGGEMHNIPGAAGDPLFYMHHANVDRLWALWQSRYPERANTYAGDAAQQVSLDELPEIPGQTVQDMFSTLDWCYTYPGISLPESEDDPIDVKTDDDVIDDSPDDESINDPVTEDSTDEEPTDANTNDPSDANTNDPSDVNTNDPSDANTNDPSDANTNDPSDVNTNDPSDANTNDPSDVNTNDPSDVNTNDASVNDSGIAANAALLPDDDIVEKWANQNQKDKELVETVGLFPEQKSSHAMQSFGASHCLLALVLFLV